MVSSQISGIETSVALIIALHLSLSLEQVNVDLTSLLCLFFFDRENLKDNENKAQQHRRQISETCGENDYNTTRESIRESIASLQE